MLNSHCGLCSNDCRYTSQPLSNVPRLSSDTQVAYAVRVQLLEIYNEQLRDLLAPAGSDGARRLDIRNTAASGLNVPDALQVPRHSKGHL